MKKPREINSPAALTPQNGLSCVADCSEKCRHLKRTIRRSCPQAASSVLSCEIDHRLFRLRARLHFRSLQHNSFSFVLFEILAANLRRDLHPGFLCQLFCLLIAARIAKELHILRAARHCHAARNKVSLREIVRLCHHCAERSFVEFVQCREDRAAPKGRCG